MIRKFCIVGTGPSGLYTAKFLQKKIDNIQIHFFEKLNTPLGLLKFGVAPDRQQVKNTHLKLHSQLNNKIFYNIKVGRDLSIDTLLRYYDYCILACGAELPLENRIQGDGVSGVFDGLDLVRWYNSYPHLNENCVEYIKKVLPGFGKGQVSVIGNGNVALDVARILLSPKTVLEKTGINPQALEAFARLGLEKVNIFGRRGWVQAQFTNKELRELLESEYILPILDPEDYRDSLDKISSRELGTRIKARSQIIYQRMVDNWKIRGSTSKKIIQFHFLKSVKEVKSKDSKNISKIIVVKNKLVIDNTEPNCAESNKIHSRLYPIPSGETAEFDCNLLIKCIGFKPSEEVSGLLPFVDNKRVFTCGWLRSGGKGDLTRTIQECLMLSQYISTLDFEPIPAADISEILKCQN